jgi:hypothetical protein
MGDVDVDRYTFSCPQGSASRPGRVIPGTHWIGGWVGPRARLDEMEEKKYLILPGLELSSSL